VYAGAAIISIAPLVLLYTTYGKGAEYILVHIEAPSYLIFRIELLIGAYLIWLAYKHKRWLVSFFVIVQLALITQAYFYEDFVSEPIQIFFYELFDIMAIIIGVIGSQICVYAVSYMCDWNMHHKDGEDRRPFFFAVMFLFLSAMSGIFFCDNLGWMYLFWEITTVCSFLLIGYFKSEEATNNAFWALTLNLIGGLVFAGGIVFISIMLGIR
jgi:ech hydrogenase subunit A